MHKR
jgi:hypothetical protein